MRQSGFLIIIALCCTGLSCLQVLGQNNISLLSNLSYAQPLSDVWGYTDSAGNEYALVGIVNGISIVDVTNPASPVEVQFMPGPSSNWRDIKVYDQHAFITNEGSGGLQIIDLTGLPDTAADIFWTGDSAVSFNSAHNVFIDENGIAYIVGADYGIGGAIIADLNIDPKSPQILGVYDTRYVHDCFVRGDTLWTAEIFDGVFSVIDVSNKTSPHVINSQSTPSNFTHNIWLSDDGKTLLTTDEVSSAFIAAYDVSNVLNISLLDVYQSNPGSGVLPHNVFIHGEFAIASYYDDGVVILDIKNPKSLVEVGNFDTSPFNTAGCWGVYPYLPSGNIIATDITEGLYVLSPNYVQAAFIEGTVTDFNSGIPINAASVSILNSSATTVTNISGAYALATSQTGSVDILYGKTGYASFLVQGVPLQNGSADTIDVDLVPAVIYTMAGNIIDKKTGVGIPGAEVLVENNFSSFSATTNSAGEFSIGGFPAEVYSITVYQWGYLIKEAMYSLSPQMNNLTIEMDTGYMDDFQFDLGWNPSGDALAGHWVREIPIGTVFFNSAVNPQFDVGDDKGAYCLITANGLGPAGNFDVDFGTATITSPKIDLSDYSDPYISFDWWFFAEEGAGSAGDRLTVFIANTTQTISVDSFDLNNTILSQWNRRIIRVLDYVTLSDSMRIGFSVADLNNENIVDAGIDRFRITDGFANVGCLTPDPILSTVLAYDEVELFWNAVAGAEKYQIRGKMLGASNWVELEVQDGSTDHVVVQNLISPAKYEWQIQAVCDELDSIYSGFSNLDTIDIACVASSNLLTTAVGTNSALLIWSAVPGAIDYTIAGRVQGSTAIITINAGISPNALPVFGLQPSTTYEWAIRTKCDVNVKSPFSSIQTFTTSSSKHSIASGIRDDSKGLPGIYPNPTRSSFSIILPADASKLEIYTIGGNLLEARNNLSQIEVFDASELPAGIYLVKVSGSGPAYVQKLIKY